MPFHARMRMQWLPALFRQRRALDMLPFWHFSLIPGFVSPLESIPGRGSSGTRSSRWADRKFLYGKRVFQGGESVREAKGLTKQYFLVKTRAHLGSPRGGHHVYASWRDAAGVLWPVLCQRALKARISDSSTVRGGLTGQGPTTV